MRPNDFICCNVEPSSNSLTTTLSVGDSVLRQSVLYCLRSIYADLCARRASLAALRFALRWSCVGRFFVK